MKWTSSEVERRRQVEAGKTVVANLRADKQLISWAKKAGCLVRICRPTKWGNPFKLGRDGDRKTVMRKHKSYIKKKPDLLAELPKLEGKVLACWCSPEQCHGDELIRLLGARRRK